jgi:hypothetical protein
MLRSVIRTELGMYVAKQRRSLASSSEQFVFNKSSN